MPAGGDRIDPDRDPLEPAIVPAIVIVHHQPRRTRDAGHPRHNSALAGPRIRRKTGTTQCILPVGRHQPRPHRAAQTSDRPRARQTRAATALAVARICAAGTAPDRNAPRPDRHSAAQRSAPAEGSSLPAALLSAKITYANAHVPQRVTTAPHPPIEAANPNPADGSRHDHPDFRPQIP